MNEKLIITPKTKVGELLDNYPELEEPLIRIAPAFKKLKNPVLRKTIARITTLEQAALVAEIGVDEIVNRLRKYAGQDELEIDDSGQNVTKGQPEWFDASRIKHSYDARAEISKGGHPLGNVMSYLPGMEKGDIYEIITPFYPAPMVERVREKGFETWALKENDGLYKNYFFKL